MPKQSLESLVTLYKEKYSPHRRRPCLVCDSANRELIEIMMRDGAGGPSIARFLKTELDETISQAVLTRHKAEHLDVDEKR